MSKPVFGPLRSPFWVAFSAPDTLVFILALADPDDARVALTDALALRDGPTERRSHMPLRQIARTPAAPIPDLPDLQAYAFAVEIRKATIPGNADTVIVRCPWCAEHHATAPTLSPECIFSYKRFTVVIPAGTPVLA